MSILEYDGLVVTATAEIRELLEDLDCEYEVLALAAEAWLEAHAFGHIAKRAELAEQIRASDKHSRKIEKQIRKAVKREALA